MSGLRAVAAGDERPVPAVAAQAPGKPVDLLVFTSLYPNAEQPRHGIFVEERLRHLVASGGVRATVIAPVPWFPLRSKRFGSYAARARVAAEETRYGIRVLHPRYPLIPKVGMSIAAALMYRRLLPFVRHVLGTGVACDIVDAHYFYPDGVAAVRIAQALHKPVVVSARGNDLTLLPTFRLPRRQIIAAAAGASAIITVAAALKAHAVALGMPPAKITVLRNGVDLKRFRPLERAPLREEFELTGPTWLAVGHLIERKGVHITLRALAEVPAATLLIAGDGPEGAALRRLAQDLHVSERVRFLGPIPHDDLPRYYSAADCLVLPSSREGMPNVVLEAIACGTPVVATAVDGTPEVIADPAAGELMRRRDPHALAAAWHRLETRAPSRAATRHYAERLGWGPVVAAQSDLYRRLLATRRQVA